MPILTSDLLYKLSTTSGSAGNQNTQPSINASLGKYISTTQVTSGLNSVFDDLSGTDNANSAVDYRCIFIHNNNGTLTWVGPVVWVTADVAGGAQFALGVDPTAASAIGAAPSQAVTIATRYTAPAGVTFSAPTSKATGLALGDIGPGQCKAIWLRRSATNSAAMANDGANIRCEGDTGA